MIQNLTKHFFNYISYVESAVGVIIVVAILAILLGFIIFRKKSNKVLSSSRGNEKEETKV